MAFVSGILELRTLRDAWHEALKSRSPAAVRLAYSRIDREFRDRISHHAMTLATQRRLSAGPLRTVALPIAPRRAERGIDGPRRA